MVIEGVRLKFQEGQKDPQPRTRQWRMEGAGRLKNSFLTDLGVITVGRQKWSVGKVPVVRNR